MCNVQVLFRYRSEPVRRVRRMLLMMPFLLGWKEETISQDVSLATNISFPPNHTISSFVVRLSKSVPLYSATLHLVAHFTGLQYWMYHWFLTSSIIGTFCIWIAFETGLLVGMMFETRRINEDDIGDDINSMEARDGKCNLVDNTDGMRDDENDRLVP
jgi:putative adipose-regulatory protein (seipin)